MNDLYHFQVCVQETDLDIAVKISEYSPKLLDIVTDKIYEIRKTLDEYIKKEPVFKTTLKPYHPLAGVLPEISEMCKASLAAGVGPMASVAGLFSEKVGKVLCNFSKDVIVENGGDIWLKSDKNRIIGLYAGDSPFSYQVGIEIKPSQMPLGICTSSGTVGHSLSFGCADAVVVLAPSAILADAVATATANQIQNDTDLEKAVHFALSIPEVRGAIAIIGDKMAVLGEVELVSL